MAYSFNKILKRCEMFSEFIKKHLDKKWIPWLLKKNHFLKDLSNVFNSHMKVLSEFSENWFDVLIGEYTAFHLLGKRGKLKNYLYSEKTNMDENDTEILKHLKIKRWEYKIFEVVKNYKNHFLKIKDLSNGGEYLLYSPGTAKLYSQNNILFFSLIFDNGECLQTYGLIHSFFDLSYQDIEYFCSILSPGFSRGDSVENVIEKYPENFYLLDTVQNSKSFVNTKDNAVISHNWMIIKLKDFNPSLFSKDWIVEKNKGVYKLKNSQFDEFPHFGEIYYDVRAKKAILYAMTEKAFDFIKDQFFSITKADELKNIEKWEISVTMKIFLESMLHEIIPSDKYSCLFKETENEDKEKNKDDEKILVSLNKALEEIITAKNSGEKIDTAAIAEKYNIELEDLEELEKSLDHMTGNNLRKIEGGIKGYKTPSPNFIAKLYESPDKCSLFTFTSDEALLKFIDKFFRSKPRVKIPKTLKSPIDDIIYLFEKKTGMQNFAFLNYLLYLFCRFGDKPRPCSQYAIEILKIFGHILYSAPAKKNIEKYIEDFSIFIFFNFLYLSGLTETADHKADKMDEKQQKAYIESGEIKVISSDILREWIFLT